MKRLKGVGFGAAFVAAIGSVAYVLGGAHLGRASAAEIEAALPAALKRTDESHPEAEARYRRLCELRSRLNFRVFPSPAVPAPSTPENEAILLQIGRLIEEGPLWIPARDKEFLEEGASDPNRAATLASYALEAATTRKDRAASARWAIWGLRYGHALQNKGGVVGDHLAAVSAEAIAIRAAYVAVVNGGLDRTGALSLLPWLPIQDGTSPGYAAAIRREFQIGLMPLLLDPPGHRDEIQQSLYFSGLYGTIEDYENLGLCGRFDPVATARLVGEIYGATMADATVPFTERTRKSMVLSEAADHGLPDPSSTRDAGIQGVWGRLKYRAGMNVQPNSIGRRLAFFGIFLQNPDVATRVAASRNLLRAAILLRTGEKAKVPDPYGKGDLRVDAKVKRVWSVGPNGRDDGGQILDRYGKPGSVNALDYGFAYGDHSWKVERPKASFGTQERKMPVPRGR